MTTLSKEDVVRMAEEAGCEIVIWRAEQNPVYGGQMLGKFCDKFATLVRADLVAENERLSKLCVVEAQEWARSVGELREQLTATRTALADMEKQRDYWIEDRNSLQFADDAKIAELSAALAAADADNERLRKSLFNLTEDVQPRKDLPTDKWGEIDVVCSEFEDALKVLAQPRDDSALRDMIAGVYEECAKECDSRADKERKKAKPWQEAGERNHALMYMQNADQAMLMAQDIRALAEKAKGE